jgi:hypothetical protein
MKKCKKKEKKERKKKNLLAFSVIHSGRSNGV